MSHPAWLRRACTAVILSSWFVAFPLAAEDEAAVRAANQQFATAAGLHNRQAFDLAADEWVKFLKDFPKDKRASEARHYLGICRLQKQDYAGAVAVLQELLTTGPKFEQIAASQLYLGLAQFNLARGGKPAEYAAADKTFAALLKSHPEGKHLAQALYYRGEALYALGKKAEAIPLYRRLIAEHADDALLPDAVYAAGVALDETGQAKEAAAAYDDFLKRFAENGLKTDVGVRRAELYLAAGDLAAAEKLFAAAAADKTYDAADYALLRQAGCTYDRKQYAEAQALYDAVAQRFPQSQYLAVAGLMGGKSAYFAQDYQAAVKRLAQFLKQTDESGVEAAHWTARAALKLGRPAEALAAADGALKAAAKSPLAAQLQLDRADALYELDGRRADALAAYRDLVSKFPQDPLAPQAGYLAAFTALELGKLDDARILADQFLKAHAAHELRSAVEYVAAESQLRNNQYDDAAKRYDALLKRDATAKDQPLWTVRRATALSLAGKHDEVIQALAKTAAQIGDDSLQAEARYLLGLSRQAKQDYAAAAADLAASLKLDPKRKQADETTLALAEAQRQNGDAKQALATLAKFATDFPQSPLCDTADYRTAELAFAVGDVERAEAAYRRLLTDHPQSRLAPHAQYGLAFSLYKRNEASEAVATADALLKRADVPADVAVQGRYVRALARHRLKQYQPAIDDFQEYLKSKPSGSDRADALYVLGLCQEAIDKKADAAATFTALLEANPKYAGAAKVLYEIGWIHKELGKPDEAVAAFARLAKEFPNDPAAAEALFHVGEAAYAKKDYAAAIDAYYDARDKAESPELAEKAAHKLGFTYYHRENYPKAEEWFRFQQEKYGTGPLAQDAAFMAGEAAFKQKKYKEALAEYAKVKQPQSPDAAVLALLHGGQSAAQLEDWKQSRTLLESAVARFPQTGYLPEINYELAWALQNLGQEDEALKLYEQVTAQTDREVAARARFMIGEVYFTRKDHAEAIRHFFKTAYGYGGYPEWQARAHFESGRCFEVLGKLQQAKQSYQEVVEKFPQFEEAALAKKRLSELGT